MQTMFKLHKRAVDTQAATDEQWQKIIALCSRGEGAQSATEVAKHAAFVRELGGGGNTTAFHHQHGSMSSSSMEPRVDYAHAGGAGMRSRTGNMLSSNLAASIAKSVQRPSAVLNPTVQRYDKLQHANGTAHVGHMPGTTVIQRRPF